MDNKKSNRTDLLAAGRKKLQQYRKKKDKSKDGKGSSNSSSGSTKSNVKDGKDADANVGDNLSVETSQVEAHNSERAVVLEDVAVASSDSTRVSSDVLGADTDLSTLETTSLNDGEDSRSTNNEGEGVGEKHESDEPVSLVTSSADGIQEGDQEADGHGLTHHDDQKDNLATSISDILSSTDQALGGSSIGVNSNEDNHTILEASVPLEDAHVAAELGNDVMDRSLDETTLHQLLNMNEESPTDSEKNVVVESGEIPQSEASTVIEIERSESMSNPAAVESIDNQSTSTGVEENSIELDVPQTITADLPQALQEQLYLANMSKDFYHGQLPEQYEEQSTRDLLLNDSSALNLSLTDLQETNKILSTELAQCKSELEGAISEKMEFQNLYNQAKEEAIVFSATVDELRMKLEATLVENERILANLASVSEQATKTEADLEHTIIGNQKLSSDLADSSAQLAALQQEVEYLKGSLASTMDERKKFEEENFELNKSLAVVNEEHKKQKDHEEFLILEIERLSAELVVFHDKLSIQHQENVVFIQEKEVLFGDLVDCKHQLTVLQNENSDLSKTVAVMDVERKNKVDWEESVIQEIERLSIELLVFQDKLLIQHQEHKSWIEQLAEENIILQSSLEIYKAKISEVESLDIQISSAGMESMAQMNIADGGSSETNLANEDTETVIPSYSDPPNSVVVMKGCLEEAVNMMHQLEKATDGMHSHSLSLSLSMGRNATPGVSKLIQAFESKASIDDPDPGANTSSNNHSESYLTVKDQIRHLRSVLRTLTRHVEHVDVLFLEEKDKCQAAEFTRRELEKEIESLKGLSNNLEVKNIELEVLFGVMNQHAHDSEASKAQLENLFNSLKLEYETLQSQNVDLCNKLTVSSSRISKLNVHLEEIRTSSNGLASTFYNEIETLQEEMKQNMYAIEREWKSSLSQLRPMAEKLDALVGSAVNCPPPSESTDSGILDHLLFSVRAACEVIEKLTLEAETHEALSKSHMQVTENLHSVDKERSLAFALLQKVSERVNGSEIHTLNSNQHDIMDADYYEAVVSKVGNLVSDLKELKESNKMLYSDLLNRTSEIEELNKYCLDSDAVLKLVLDVNKVLNLQDTEMELDKAPVVQLQSSVLLLLQKFKDTEQQSHSLTKECDDLSSLNIQHQNEMLILKESLTHAKQAFGSLQAELLEKTKELEQSDQRVTSVREKLSIAVAKGKGLVVQRDSLKHSLADMSNELEKRSQEVLLKDSRILEVEEKLKAYSEAGERMEALESELTYIRNSATALRESFLMKDSTLQRIEEIMEDLELPDHFHAKDIVEKVDWLAKSVAGNSFLHADWDQRSSVGGGSYSDTGLVTDGGKEDVQPNLNPVDDLRRQYDELQTKFYELAEQNDMLEQSLMERNVLVQRWEEILDRINTPPQIRSMEPEERIHWLGTALSEADHHMRSLQQKIENLENYCESLSSDLDSSRRRISEKDNALSVADDHVKSCQQKIYSLESDCGSLSSQLEESERRISEFESSLQVILHSKEVLSGNLVALTSDHELALHTVAQYEHDVDRLRKDLDTLQGRLTEKLENDSYIQQTESELRRLRGLILEVLQDSEAEVDSSDVSNNNMQCLERLIRKLMGRYRGVHSEDASYDCGASEIMARDVENMHVPVENVIEEQKITDLKTELAEALAEVAHQQKENDEYSKKNQSIAIELEELDKSKYELQELLKQEEQKSTSLREKLNLAVKKGKSLIQQRDSLKQNIQQATNEIERLKSEICLRENSILESGQKISDLSHQIEAVKAFEADNLSLKNRLVEAEQHLQHNEHNMRLLINKLGEIDTGNDINAHDPFLKLEGIEKMCFELRATTVSFEQDATKSKKAAELLLTELNEVQERNDGLQEELTRAYNKISTLSSERDLADSAKVEALSHLARFSDERKFQHNEMEQLKSSICEVKQVFLDMSTVANDVFAKDLELLNGVKAQVNSCLEHMGEDPVATKDYCGVASKDYGGVISTNQKFKDFWSRNSRWNSEIPDLQDDDSAEQHLKHLTEAIGKHEEIVHSHSLSLRTEAEEFNNAITTMQGAIDSRSHSLESIINGRDMEVAVLRKSLSFLYEACCSSITEIMNKKAQLTGHSLTAEDLKVNLPSLPSLDGGNVDKSSLVSTEECIEAVGNDLMKAVNGFANIRIEDRESQSKEMRSVILDLQKELQEKDIQRERICLELVGQIKEAESTASKYSQDLQSAKNYAQDLEIKLEATRKERTLLEQRAIELQQGHASSIELGEKVEAMTSIVAAKEQEIEVLMQALDEEESQMEALRSKVEELESTVQQKNSDLEHVETSRAKAVKKLSTTVSKFDELHRMSESLLSEIENLQSQLQDRDSEISFLRQEVTRCTNDALESTKMSKEQSYADHHEFLTWLESTISRVLICEGYSSDDTVKNYAECKEKLRKDITSIVSELEDSRIASHNKDELLQAERNKVEELSRRKASLESSLNEKELRLINSLQGAGASGLGTSEIVEVEPVVNTWTPPATSSTSQVRGWRKANNDQVAIAIDTDAGSSGRFEDEDDDKVHGFKSLTTSRFVPKFTRPVSDVIDGLWVSCDRTLMRQPAFRLGIMFYWALLHALLASVVV